MGTRKITAVENRHFFINLDAGGAYLNADIGDKEDMFMELAQNCSGCQELTQNCRGLQYKQWLPSLKECMQDNRRLLVRV